jgi:hypothetical protein
MGRERASHRSAAAPSLLAERVVRVLVRLSVALFLVTSAAHLLDLVVWDRSVLLLDVEAPESVAAWASSMALGAAAAASGLLAIIRVPLDRGMLVLAVAFGLLSADDDIGIFDQVLRHRLPSTPDPDLVVWLIGFAPLMALSAILVIRLAPRVGPPYARPLLLGLAGLAVAIAGELLVTIIDIPALEPGAAPYELEAALEEGLELLGVSLIAAGLFGLVVDAIRARLEGLQARSDAW